MKELAPIIVPILLVVVAVILNRLPSKKKESNIPHHLKDQGCMENK